MREEFGFAIAVDVHQQGRFAFHALGDEVFFPKRFSGKAGVFVPIGFMDVNPAEH